MENNLFEECNTKILQDLFEEVKKLNNSRMFIPYRDKITDGYIQESQVRSSLNITKKTLIKIVEDGKLGCTNIEGSLFIKIDDVKSYMNYCYSPSKLPLNEE